MTPTSIKEQLFDNIVRLRRAERQLADDSDVLAVRTDLERELGPTVSRSLAARLLGVSHPTLNRWATSGDLPLVFTPHGRKEVPVHALIPLREAVEDERRAGRRHALEPVFKRGRSDAWALDPERLVHRERSEAGPDPDRHRIAQLRSLAYHRAVAARLTQPMVDDARRLLWQWQHDEKIHPTYATRWRHILELPLDEIQTAIGDDAPESRDLRQSSPFAGLLSEPERRKIIERIA